MEDGWFFEDDRRVIGGRPFLPAVLMDANVPFVSALVGPTDAELAPLGRPCWAGPGATAVTCSAA